ncbi:MAG TPA: hypothetical protein VMR62_18335 [Bryobacteraceae bacterium]|jgi:hypothetical protein|nr:hypothetical protein [Bryobacteraceae bacterium]
MSPALRKERVETVIGVVAVDLVLTFSNCQFSGHYAEAGVRPVGLVFELFLVVFGIAFVPNALSVIWKD